MDIVDDLSTVFLCRVTSPYLGITPPYMDIKSPDMVYWEKGGAHNTCRFSFPKKTIYKEIYCI